MNPNIFREYDIRGIVKDDFPEDVVFNIGRSYGSILIENNQKNISISGDIRYSTKRLKNNLIEGLLSTGINVYDMGILPTPLNYFSLYHTDIKNSIQVTGSHNPKEYNGFKISFNKKPFFGKDIKNIESVIKNDLYTIKKNKGIYHKIDIVEDYIDMIKSQITIDREISCIMDCGNSVGGLVAPSLFKELGITVDEIYCEINPDFPNHHPDPTVDANLSDIISQIKSSNYDLGVAFDGDADRIVPLDEKGSIIRPDILLALFVPDIINSGDSIVYDVKCSKSLEDIIRKCKGNPIMYKTGHSLIKNKMIESNSKLGGEMSGHIFFSDRYYGYDDGIYVALRLIEKLSKKNINLSEYIAEIPQYISTPEIRIDCIDDNEKFILTEKLVSYFSQKFDCNLIDGVRINFKNGWALIRASNTQPVLVCRCEAEDEQKLNNIKEIIFDKIKYFGGDKIEL